MRILLSPSIWMLVKPAYIVVLISFRIAVAFAAKNNDALKLNVDAW